ALIVSLAAGLLVSKGGTRGTAEQAVLGQLGAYPRALFVAAGLMLVFAVMPGMPFAPFALLSVLMGTIAYLIPRRLAEAQSKIEAEAKAKERQRLLEHQESEAVKDSLKTAEIELRLGKHLAVQIQPTQQELAHRVGRMRRKFAQQYGFVVPDIKLVESHTVPSKSYEVAIHGTVIAAQQVRTGETMIVVGDGPMPGLTGEEVREPAFGMRAVWVPEAYAQEARREGFSPIDWPSVMLTHVSEVIRNNLPQLLSYKDLRMLIDRLDAEYKRLVDDICPSQISYSGLQAVLKLLLAERVSIRNLHLIIEAIAEIVPHARRAEQIAEHVRLRIAQQICGDLAENGVLNVLRLGSRWDLTFHQGLKRDAKGDVVEVDIDPRLIEQFGTEASEAIRTHMKATHRFALVTAPEVRSYVRMIIERLFPTVAVLSHVEIARGVEIKSLGTIS
ncbi:MAG: FHIPEP family type III secretion protein, partial [Parafilimonas terrae]|nr:FHIPEP family type III secretion protein [Parafilimonas terrae]